MNNPTAVNTHPPRRIGQSILALFVGFVAGVVLSPGTDFSLHAVGFWPAVSQPMTAPLLLIATIYRTIYGILSAYIVARLAPYPQAYKRERLRPYRARSPQALYLFHR
jgi:hypothetical protein